MVIQRWQSLFLLVAAVAMGLASWLSLGTIATADAVVAVKPLDILPLFIVNALSAVVMLIDIFLYRDLRIQKRIATVGIVLSSVAVIVTGVAVQPSLQLISNLSWTIVLPLLALGFTIIARSRMAADERLLRSYDRLR